MLQIIILAISLLICVYSYLNYKYSYWFIRGVKGPLPIYVIGNVHTRGMKSPADLELEWMKKYGKFYGVYNGMKPALIVLEPELIKQILIKDFPMFINRLKLNIFHEMWNQNLIFALDDQWKRVRTITSPNFTTGKLKRMYPLMSECVSKLTNYLDDLVDNENGIMDTKEVIAGFTIDVIASTSFGTETDANGDRNKANQFVQNGRKIFDVDPMRVFAVFVFPKWLLRMMDMKTFLNPKLFDFFINFTKHVLDQRKSGVVSKRNDFVQLLLDASVDENELKDLNYEHLSIDDEKDVSIDKIESSSKSNKKTLTESEIIAQCIAFFTAGFETTASVISYCLFELAHNGKIQDKLNQEIISSLSQLDEKSDLYLETVITRMPYIEAIVKETLRLYPSITRLNRTVECDKYNLNGIVLNKDDLVEIPVYAIHHCPEFYPEPERFNPDRFLPENRSKLIPYTYLPFGAGPRNCIGMRFAYQEIKLCLAKLLCKYRFEVTPETPKKLTFKNGNPQLNAHSFPLKFVPINDFVKNKNI